MVFSSLQFIFLFLPCFLCVYYAVPFAWKNTVLLFGSLIFYALGTLDKPEYIVLLILSILVNFVLASKISKTEKNRKALLIISLVYNFAWLFLFKYATFFLSGVNQLIALIPKTNFQFRAPELLLPTGISFYTFQAVSYLIDVYRKTCAAETSPIRLGTYICMFPQLIAGPIVTYGQVAKQLQNRTHSVQLFLSGLKLFILGLGSKVLLANQLGGLWSDINAIGYDSISTPLAWMGIAAYSFQIYFDFWGYSLMAIGLGKMLGFQLPKNFCFPYMSVSMTEFWRRWHITLGSWFREYVYIPLGGSRNGKWKTYRNLFVVWLLTGLWHGAHINFLLWGLFLFAVIAVEKAGLKKFLDGHKALGHIYMLFLIPSTWTLFAITDLSQLSLFLGRLFPFFTSAAAPVFRYDFLKYIKEYGVLLLCGLLFSTKLPAKLYKKINDNWVGTLLLLILFWASVYCLYIGLNDPFLYFRF